MAMLRLVVLLLLLTLAAPRIRAQALLASTPAGRAGGPSALPPTPTAKAPAAPRVYHAAEQPPAFPGGAPAFLRFLQSKLKYPEEALRQGISGKVYVGFTVTEEGRLLDPKIVRGLGAGLDEEALRLVRIMPFWTPGLVGGQPVRVAYTLPIVFRSLE